MEEALKSLALNQPSNFIVRHPANLDLYTYPPLNPENISGYKLGRVLQVPLEKLVFTAIDTESTWQNPRQFTEIAAVKFTLGGMYSYMSSVIQHDMTNEILREEKRNLWKMHLQTAPELPEVLRALETFCQDTIIVEYSGSHIDTKNLKGKGFNYSSDLRIDLCTWVQKLVQLESGISLRSLSQQLGIPTFTEAHRALPDAESTALSFIKVIEIGQKKLGWKTLASVQKSLKTPKYFDTILMRIPKSAGQLVSPLQTPKVAEGIEL